MKTPELPLSPFDSLFVGAHAPPVLMGYHRTTMHLHPQFRSTFDQLASELVTVRGTLKQTEEHSFCFADGGPGPQFTTVEVPALPDVLDSEALLKLADPVRSLPGEPLFRVRTVLAPGQALLLVSASHASFDGVGFARFVLEWGRRLQGLEPIRLSEDRTPLIPTGALPPADLDPEEFDARVGRAWIPGARRGSPFEGTYEREFFPESDLEAELERVRTQDPSLSLQPRNLLAPLLVRNRARALGSNGVLKTRWAISLRGRAKELAPTFLGNGFCSFSISVPAELALGDSLLPIVRRLDAGMREVPPDFTRTAGDYLEAYRRARGLGFLDELEIRNSPTDFSISDLIASEGLGKRVTYQGIRVKIRNLSPVPDVCYLWPETRGPVDGFTSQIFRTVTAG